MSSSPSASHSLKPRVTERNAASAQCRRERRNVRERQARARKQQSDAATGSTCEHFNNCSLFALKTQLSHAFGSVHGSGSAWPAEIAPSGDSDTVSTSLVGSRHKTLCGSCTMGLVPPASPQCNSQENEYGVLPIGAEVVSLAKHWLTLHMGSQDTRVSRCPLHELEVYVTSLCELSKRQVPAYLTRSSDAMARKIGEIFRATMRVIAGRATTRAQAYVLPFANDASSPYLHNVDQFKAHLEVLFGPEIYMSLTDPCHRATRTRTLLKPAPTHICKAQPVHVAKHSTRPSVLDWPQIVPKDVVNQCCKDYREATKYKRPVCCAVCGRERLNAKIFHHQIQHDCDLPKWMELLRIPAGSPFFDNCNESLNVFRNIMLCPKGVTASDHRPVTVLAVCDQCQSSLFNASGSRLPKFALANKLFLGKLPSAFDSLTWVEEQVCALHRSTIHVYRLYYSDDPRNPYQSRGNACAHPQNIASTAKVLPRTPADINDIISVVFTGPSTNVPKSVLKTNFRVRKQMVWDLLIWLQQHNPLYRDIELSVDNLELYKDDDALPGVEDRVIVNQTDRADDMFDEETTAFEPHPAASSGTRADQGENSRTFIEHMGVYDANGSSIPARVTFATGLRKLSGQKRPNGPPDLIIPRSADPVSEYYNPSLFPGMFPSLFPYGVGGFDDDSREVTIGFRAHIEYLLDLADRRFRYHRSFLFIALNIFQRHMCHSETSLTVTKSRYDAIAPKLASLTPEVINRVARHIEKEGKVQDLTSQEKDVLILLREVNAVSKRIPGSMGSKLYARNEIRAYMAYFGLPHLYITLNPNPSHSPIFQVIWGDETVDLDARFPDLVDAAERGIRLASDPVAGADFFQFSLDCFLTHLMGWDKVQNCSSANGGIFGMLRAYYGSAEFTDRGNLHGHFLLWLDGGLNPSDVHAKMRADTDGQWTQRFFNFFDDIIKHSLPDTGDTVDPTFEPRVQRPPDPSDPDFEAEFNAEVKKCGEILQRHSVPCKPVCTKYGSTECRFGFPHEVVNEPRFEPNTNSIVLRCEDPMINWYNPHVLTFCRHNHDIKCILSGKSAKAAMFYITDYITKNDEKLHQILSMFSTAVASHDGTGQRSASNLNARQTLHRCLAAVLREQKIHGQQAARYLRGFGDAIPSHQTVPMLSRQIALYVKSSIDQKTQPTSVEASSPDNHGNPSEKPYIHDGELEDAESFDEITEELNSIPVRISKNSEGYLYQCDQVQDYLYRSSDLSCVNFYDFVRCYRKEKVARVRSTGKYRRFTFQPEHPEAGTHILMETIDPCEDRPVREIVPLAIGCSIPRCTKDSSWYMIFMLAHFIPFSANNPLDVQQETLAAYFEVAPFSDRSRFVMRNWDAIHECEDERDSERLRKQQSKINKSKNSAHLYDPVPDDYMYNGNLYAIPETDYRPEEMDPETAQMRAALASASWFERPTTSLPLASTSIAPADASRRQVSDMIKDPVGNFADKAKGWKQQIRQQETAVAAARRAQLDPSRQSGDVHAAMHLGTEAPFVVKEILPDSHVPETRYASTSKTELVSWENNLNDIVQCFTLNDKQRIAFLICAQRFKELLKSEQQSPATPQKPLRMCLTGPGGTGKTHVVNALRELMSRYGRAYRIRLLAPTGGAASLIGGQTIHSGLGISVVERKRGDAKQPETDLCGHISAKKKFELRAEWRNVDFVLIDEVSMVGQDLLCKLDAVLRFVLEKPDEWFGGVNIIVSGDFYQHSPVKARPLYMPISNYGKGRGSFDAMSRQGRMAWKQFTTVVELTEQKRMAADPDFARAVSRLRRHQCDAEDIKLFNSLLVRSIHHPHGVEFSDHNRHDAVAIVDRNTTRRILNSEKARAITSAAALGAPRLYRCFAKHMMKEDDARRSGSRVEVPPHVQNDLFHNDVDSRLSPLLELYIGAPVVAKSNISVELGITNGQQGTLRALQVENLASGEFCAAVAIVEFPNSLIQLDGLPPHCFPLYPISETIKQMVSNRETGKSFIVTAQRWQLPIQLAFSITGHGAQGKTMRCVAADLNSSGPGAYVAASRATRRQDLILTRPVTLHTLNAPLNRDLVREMRRLDALAHNTLVQYGHIDAEPVVVPDAELDVRTSTRITFEVDDDSGFAPRTRRKKAADANVNVHEPASKSARGLPSTPIVASRASTMRLRSHVTPPTAYPADDAASSTTHAEPELAPPTV